MRAQHAGNARRNGRIHSIQRLGDHRGRSLISVGRKAVVP
jgi:hypothetical protein